MVRTAVRSGWTLALVVATGIVTSCQGEGSVETAIEPIGTVELDGAVLRYVVEGEGEPCLVIGSATYYPRTFSERFRRHFKCAFLDTRAFEPGAQHGASGRYDLEASLEDVDRMRQALGWDRVAVVGHSMHGMMALDYARRYPEHVTRVVAIGAPPVVGEQLTAAIESLWAEQASEERKSAHAENWQRTTAEAISQLEPSDQVIATYVTNGAMYWADPHYDATWLWDGVEINVPLLNEFFPLLEAFDLEAAAREVTAPVFIALGRHDYVVPFTAWTDRWEGFASPTFELFDHSGHTPQLEEPEEFDRRLEEWLSS